MRHLLAHLVPKLLQPALRELAGVHGGARVLEVQGLVRGWVAQRRHEVVAPVDLGLEQFLVQAWLEPDGDDVACGGDLVVPFAICTIN